MDRFQAMQLFVRIVELGSFSRAAEQQGISRASATAQLKQLECHLGTRLLQRTTRQVNPTLDGQTYYHHCLAILASLEAAEGLLSQHAQHPRGRLKVDLPASFGRLQVIPALPEFHARYPEITLEIGLRDRMIDLVREGVDCVVRIGSLGDSSLIARPLAALPQVTCASRDYLARHGHPHHLSELAGHQCIEYLSSTTGRVQPLEFCVDGRVEMLNLPTCLAVNHGESYVAACEAGLGIIQVPRYHVASQLQSGRLLEILPAFRPAPLPMHVLYAHHQHLAPRLRVFIDWLIERFAPDGAR